MDTRDNGTRPHSTSTALDCTRPHSKDFDFDSSRTKSKRRAAFTLIELLIVISIIAVVATLATGAAVKAIKQGKVKRMETTAEVLGMAIMNYRTQRGNWPFTRPGAKSDGDFSSSSSELRWIHGGKDSKAGDVWTKLYKNGYLDGSGINCYYKGEIRQLNDVSRKSVTGGLQIGYRDPNESTWFRYYCIQFNTATESVRVYPQNHGSCPTYENH